MRFERERDSSDRKFVGDGFVCVCVCGGEERRCRAIIYLPTICCRRLKVFFEILYYIHNIIRPVTRKLRLRESEMK